MEIPAGRQKCASRVITMDDRRVIATFDTSDEAEQAADLLRDEEVAVDLEEAPEIDDDSMIATSGSGGMLLQVRADDEERAREVLGPDFDEAIVPETDETDPFSETDPLEEEEWEEMTEGLHCPECHSKDLGLGTPIFQGLVVAVIVAFGAMFVVPDHLSTLALTAWGILLVVLVAGLGMRRFPLVCKECGHRGLRHEFDPTQDA